MVGESLGADRRASLDHALAGYYARPRERTGFRLVRPICYLDLDIAVAYHTGGPVEQAEGIPYLLVWETLHPYQHTAGASALFPVVLVWRKTSPAAQVEVADAEVRS